MYGLDEVLHFRYEEPTVDQLSRANDSKQKYKFEVCLSSSLHESYAFITSRQLLP